MKKIFIITLLSIMTLACNNQAKTETDEQKQRDSIDAAQRIKDSLEVEAKMLEDMNAADTTHSGENHSDTTK
jgi:hypothetical protein